MTVAARKRLSLEEFLSYDNGTGSCYELEDGVLIEMGAESPINTWIAIFLIQCLSRLGLAATRFGIKQLIQVESSHTTARDPDLIIHSEDSAAALNDGRQEACLRLGEPNPLRVIEIVSPGQKSSDNDRRDYDRKPQEYAQRGIPEMWQIDVARAWVRGGLLKDEVYEFSAFQGNDALVSPTFPELQLTASEVLRAGHD